MLHFEEKNVSGSKVLLIQFFTLISNLEPELENV